MEMVYLMSRPNLVLKIKEGGKESTSEMARFNPNEK